MKATYSLLVVVLYTLYAVSAEDESVKHGKTHYKDGEHDDKYDHEAILGSEDDVEEFSHLSPEESKERLGKLFPMMDADSSGKVDEKELAAWILKSFSKLNLEDTKMRMKTDDRDKDGFVTWDEYLESTYGMSESELEEFKKDDVDAKESQHQMDKGLAYDKKKFKAADENGDGKLSPEDATAFLHPYDYDRMSAVEVDRVFDEYDNNNDGKIDIDEYIGHATFSQKNEEDMMGERENFAYNDGNKDGSLDRSEVLKWVSPDMESVAAEEASHLIDETDANQDGYVDLDEVLKQSDLWVGSEVSDVVMTDPDHDEL